MDKNENGLCPVCNKEVKLSEIESHVDRCLFLNSDVKRSSVKRSSENCGGTSQGYQGQVESNGTPKRPKTLLGKDLDKDVDYILPEVRLYLLIITPSLY